VIKKSGYEMLRIKLEEFQMRPLVEAKDFCSKFEKA